jgi:diguanylate cyclase (GGDEF)-like protein
VGVSRGAHMKTLASDEHEQLDALQSPDALVAASFAAVRQRGTGATSGSFSFDDASGRSVQVGHAHLDPALGLDWLIIAAVPRDDMLAGLHRGLLLSTSLAGLATLAALAIGWAVFSLVRRELQRLADMARRVGDGLPDAPPETTRADELGDLARSLADMQRRLLTDQLTGLSNRGAMLRRVEDRILQQRRRGDRWPFAVMRVDVDRFAELNDRFGHAAGDAALTEVGQRLRAGVRIGDIVARYAGDEFLLLLESVENRADAEAARAHLAAALAGPLPGLDGTTVQASFGIALYPDDGQDADALLRHAGADLLASRNDPDAPHP